MHHFRSIVLILFIALQGIFNSHAQLGMSHEIGVLVGPASFFTDYGERYNLQNNISNSGFGIGLVHYINFSYKADCDCYARDLFFNDHFRIRNEIDYFFTNLEHFGPVAAKKDLGGVLLRSMHGKTQTYEIGTHLEYYPLSIRDYTNFAYLFSPFVSLGIHYVYYKPDAFSDLGPLTDPNNIFPTFIGGIDFSGGSTFSIVGSLGTRYKLGRSSDLMIEGRWQYYDTDWIDGLNIDAPQNKYNDFAFWLNVGYIYYLNF